MIGQNLLFVLACVCHHTQALVTFSLEKTSTERLQIDEASFLASDDTINWQHPTIRSLAKDLQQSTRDETIEACFKYVRDGIEHSIDYKRNPVTCKASDVLQQKTGFCFAKSHLLAALLRANNIPTGFCYQRLCLYDNHQAPYTLHGLNAVQLENRQWYRLDARGNKPSRNGELAVETEFQPPLEALAYPGTLTGEATFDQVLSEPLKVVVDALDSCETWEELVKNLPDAASIS